MSSRMRTFWNFTFNRIVQREQRNRRTRTRCNDEAIPRLRPEENQQVTCRIALVLRRSSFFSASMA